jgi:RecA/RadA recombinase
MSAALDALREQIRILEGHGGHDALVRRRVASGVSAVDALLGGLPSPGIVELSGPEGSGRTRVAAGIAAALTRVGRPVAWVDARARLYPPALADLGVVLGRMLIVRPPEDGGAPWAWATEQLLRSGVFPLVVVDFPERTGVRRALAHGWARAAERGGSTGLVIAGRPVRELPTDVRVAVGGPRRELVVVRDRAGVTGGVAPVPDWPERACPWTTTP